MEPIWLEWSDGRGPQRLALTGPVTIGRTPGNTIQIDEPGVSRRHCRVTARDGRGVVDARGSTNGVRVEGERLQSAALAPGAEFQVGSVTFRIAATESSGNPQPATREADRLALRWHDGRGERRVPLDGTVTIGRTPGNAIQVNAPGVSRNHCRVTAAHGQVQVDARGSTNGVRVGGKRVESATLQLGEQFQVGDVVFGVEAGIRAGTRRSKGPLVGVAAAMLATVVGIGAIIGYVITGSSPGTPALGDGGLLPAMEGTRAPVEPFDASTWHIEETGAGFSVRLPPDWVLKQSEDDSVIELVSPEGAASSQPYGIRFRITQTDLTDGANMTHGQRLQVGRLDAVLRRDKYFGLPWHEVHVSIPLSSGFLVVEAPFGPGVNLEPQLMEILRGVDVQ